MSQRKNLAINQRAAVVTLSKELYSGHAIARNFKVIVCAVQKNKIILKRLKELVQSKSK